MSKSNLAMAYAVKRKAKKMAKGGMVDNEKLHPEHEEDDAIMEPDQGDMMGAAGDDENEPSDGEMKIMVPMMHGMVKHIMAKRMAAGGMVAEDGESIDDAGDEIHPDNDFLSDEEDTPYFHKNMEEDEDPKKKRRSMLDSIMSKK